MANVGSDKVDPTPAGPPPPDRIAAGFKVVLGLAFGAASVYLFTLHASQSWNEPKTGAGVVTGMAAGFCAWLLLSGGLQFAGKKWGLPRGIAVFLVLAVAGGIVEPRVLQAGRLREERRAYDQLQASPGRFEDYERYQRSTSIPRRGVAGPMALAQVKEELERHDAKKSGVVDVLRRLITHFSYIAKDEEPGAMQPAIDLARDGLSRAYARGLEELAQRAGTTGEFPEDPGMRATFRKVLEHLARSDVDLVYLVFSSENKLDETAGFIALGDAFSPDRERKRRWAFIEAMEGALKKAFTEPLVRIKALEAGDPRDGKVIFDVRCATRTVPGEFTLTREGKTVGKLLNLEVAWEFAVLDAGGKELTRHRSRSNPAESFKIRRKRDDPDWAAYSVMLDSSYYNFCREISGRLGMIPPEVRESFSFER
jgi:hypothetical protein